MAEQRPEWADWLREQFDSHPTIRINADLVRAGGEKDNGRPRIDASTVTQWLRGRKPSYELAMATAEAFGRPISEALVAAGFRLDAEQRGESVGDGQQDGAVFRRDPDIDIALRALVRAGEKNAENAAELNAAITALARALGREE